MNAAAAPVKINVFAAAEAGTFLRWKQTAGAMRMPAAPDPGGRWLRETLETDFRCSLVGSINA